MKLFKKIKEALKKTREALARKLDFIFSRGELNDEFYDELVETLLSCDVGVETGEEIANRLRIYARANKLRKAAEVKKGLKIVLKKIIDEAKAIHIEFPAVVLIVGVNGVGKTTTVGKLAYFFKQNKKEVMLVAADTFRAGATEQLTEWANRNKVKIIKNDSNDSASVVFDGIKSAKAKQTDVLLVDTAGRLHTKINLMQEFEKINRITSREFPEAKKYTFLVIDAITGQNALSQLQTFKNYVEIDGLILTKLDSTSKGGIIISVAKEFNMPTCFVGVGEKIEDLEIFDSQEFVDGLF